MHKISLSILITLLLVSSTSLAQNTIEKCGTHALYLQRLAENPEIGKRMNKLEAFTENWIKAHEDDTNTREIITIPVVVHVVYRQTDGNISDEQIQSQFDVLNKDYRKLNEEIATVATAFQDDIADVEIEFCLANRDPDGNETTGITRTQTNKLNIGNTHDIFHTDLGGEDAWDESHYLNIWVTELSPGYLGYAKYPGTAAPGEDGAVIASQYFGTMGSATNSYPYNKGRTVTHEIGHYFNLLHVWGETEDCSSPDYVVDTPSSSKSYLGECPFQAQFSCGSQDMHMDFMYYTDDACLGMFTKGQKLRMMAALNGPRAGLLDSNGCTPVTDIPDSKLSFLSVYPNPAHGQLFLDFNTSFSGKIDIDLFDTAGKRVKSWRLATVDFEMLDVASLTRGIYFLQVRTALGMINRKVVLVD